MKMNTQARVKGRECWASYGCVTHQAAAEKHAIVYPVFFCSIIETRWEGKDTVFPHFVVRRTNFDVTQLRKDNDE